MLIGFKATTGRPGARFGPAGIRRGSQRISPDGWSIYTGVASKVYRAYLDSN